ncbi:MAG: hypothetical protein R3E95_18285 [Thiolinea sp.]
MPCGPCRCCRATYRGRYNARIAPCSNPKQAARHLHLTRTVEQPSGHAIIQVDDQAENAIAMPEPITASSHEYPGPLADARTGDWLLLQNECSATAAMIATAAQAGLWRHSIRTDESPKC